MNKHPDRKGSYLVTKRIMLNAGDDILRRDFQYRDSTPKDVDRVTFADKIDDLVEGRVDYDVRKGFPDIAVESLAYLVRNMQKPHEQQVKEIFGHMWIMAGVETLYKEYLESLAE